MFSNEIEQRWSFKRRISVGFAFTLGLLLLICSVSVLALRSVILTQDEISFNHAQDLIIVEKLRSKAHEKVAIYRGFLLTRSWLYMADASRVESEFRDLLKELKSRPHNNTDEQKLLSDIIQSDKDHDRDLGKAIQMRKRNAGLERVGRFFDEKVMPQFDRLDRSLNRFALLKEKQLAEARQESSNAASRALTFIVVIGIFALLSAGTLASYLTRTLARLYGDAQKALQDRNDMMAVVSHDLGNFLTSIQMSTHLLFRKAKQDEQGRLPVNLVQTIQTSAQQMNRLIIDLVDLAKLQSGQFSIEKTQDDAKFRMQECVRIMKVLAEKKDLLLQDDLPSDSLEAHWDKNRISQVVANLLANAIKFTPAGGTITVRLHSEDDQIVCSVSDTGPGIPADQLDSIFERYWQAKATSKQGSGLGLYIARAIVQAHGGEIWAESELGRGATFIFSVPKSVDAIELRAGLKTALREPSAKIAEKTL